MEEIKDINIQISGILRQGRRKWVGGGSPKLFERGGIPSPLKKYSYKNFTEYSVKVVIDALENKYKFKIYMRKSLYV